MDMFTQKRGQTTIFIIIGLVIVIIIALFFVIRSNIQTESRDVSFSGKVGEVREFTQDCIDSTVKNGLKTISSRAGYYTMPSNVFSYSGNNYVYVYYGETPYYVDEQQVIENIKQYITDKLDGCIDGYKSFNSAGYSVKKDGDINIEVSLDQLTSVSVKYPVLIKKGEETTLLEEFNTVNVGDGLKQNLANVKSLVDKYIADEGLFTPQTGAYSNCDDIPESDVYFCRWTNLDNDMEYNFIFVLE